MTTPSLQATPFRGDVDVEELHDFFRPEHQFDGDARWTFGTSLMSAYVNTFEFMNHAPVVQLWRDEAGAIQAVSRLSLGTGEWFHQAAAPYRHPEITKEITQQADAAFALLTNLESWNTVRYESAATDIGLLQDMGYERDDIDEVFMTQTLDEPIQAAPLPMGVEIRFLDRADPDEVHQRALAQIDAFSDNGPGPSEVAWITRSLPHQLSYGRPNSVPGVIAVDPQGTVLAFADSFLDRVNRIGEFEPVGTRKAAQRRGLGKAVATRSLQDMQERGMTRAIVRTGHGNRAAIRAYESVGFTTTDLLLKLRKHR